MTTIPTDEQGYWKSARGGSRDGGLSFYPLFPKTGSDWSVQELWKPVAWNGDSDNPNTARTDGNPILPSTWAQVVPDGITDPMPYGADYKDIVFGSGTPYPLKVRHGEAPYDLPAIVRMGYWLRKVAKLSVRLSVGGTHYSIACSNTTIPPTTLEFELIIPEYRDPSGSSFISVSADHDVSFTQQVSDPDDPDSCVSAPGLTNVSVSLNFDMTKCLIDSDKSLASRPFASKAISFYPAWDFSIFLEGGIYQTNANKVRIFEAGAAVTDIITNERAASVTINDYFGGLLHFDLWRDRFVPDEGVLLDLQPLGDGSLVSMTVTDINRYWEIDAPAP